MSKLTFDEVLDEVRALTTEEQRHLRELLNAWLINSISSSTEDEFEQRLFEMGLLSELKPPITDLSPYENRKPVKTKGKPLSEIIIEERR